MVTENVEIVVRERGVRTVQASLNALGRSANTVTRNFRTLQNALFAIGGAGVLRSLQRQVDTYVEYQNRLKLVTRDSRELATVTEQLFKISRETRSSFEGTATLFSRTALSLKALGTSTQETLEFTRSLNQAIVLSGAGAQEARAASIQLAQGLASNTLRGDELRSVLEQLPFVADIIARRFNATRGELRALAEQGRLTAPEILAAFQDTRSEIDAAFQNTQRTIGQSTQVLSDQFLKFIGELNDTIGFVGLVSDAILFLSRNIDILVGSVIAVVGAFAAFGAVRLGSFLVGLARDAANLVQRLRPANLVLLGTAEASKLSADNALVKARADRLAARESLALARATEAETQAALRKVQVEVNQIRTSALLLRSKALLTNNSRLQTAAAQLETNAERQLTIARNNANIAAQASVAAEATLANARRGTAAATVTARNAAIAYNASLGGILARIPGVLTGLRLLRVGFASLGGPLGIALLAFTLFGGAIGTFIQRNREQRREIAEVEDAIESYSNELKEADATAVALSRSYDQLNLSTARALRLDLIRQRSLSSGAGAAALLADAQDRVNIAIEQGTGNTINLIEETDKLLESDGFDPDVIRSAAAGYNAFSTAIATLEREIANLARRFEVSDGENRRRQESLGQRTEDRIQQIRDEARAFRSLGDIQRQVILEVARLTRKGETVGPNARANIEGALRERQIAEIGFQIREDANKAGREFQLVSEGIRRALVNEEISVVRARQAYDDLNLVQEARSADSLLTDNTSLFNPRTLTEIASRFRNLKNEFDDAINAQRELISNTTGEQQAEAEQRLLDLTQARVQAQLRLNEELGAIPVDATLAQLPILRETILNIERENKLLFLNNNERRVQQAFQEREVQLKRQLLPIEQELLRAAVENQVSQQALSAEFVSGAQTLQDLIDRRERLIQITETGAEANALFGESLREVNRAILEQQIALGDGTFLDGFTLAIDEALPRLEEFSANVGEIFANSIGSAVDGISQSITQTIFAAENLGDALINVGRAVAQELVQALIKLGLQFVLQAVLGNLLQAAATKAAAAQAAALTQIWAPAASLAATATSGGAAIAGQKALAAGLAFSNTLAAGQAAVVKGFGEAGAASIKGAGGGIPKGFREGGYTGDYGVNTPAGVVHGGEFVVNARRTREFRDVLEMMNSGALSKSRGGGSVKNFNVRMNIAAQDAESFRKSRKQIEAELQRTIRRAEERS